MRLLKIAPLVALFFLITAPIACAQQTDQTIVASPTAQNLNAITPGGMYNMSLAWAVGDDGTIIHWDGDQTWELSTSPTTANLYSVSMSDPLDAWAVGGESDGTGVIIRWNGTEWNSWNNITLGEQDGTIPTLYSVSMLDASFGWAVGADGVILVYDSIEWAGSLNLAPNTLRSVAVVSATDAWAVGDNGLIMRWTGVEWEEVSSPTNTNLYSVFMFNETDGWAVGGQSGTGTVLHWDGTNWTRWTEIALYHPLMTNGEMGDSPEDAFVDSVNATMYSVFVCDTGEGWAAGESGMTLSFNGTIWIGASNEASTATLRGIAVVNPTYMGSESKGYAVGDGGVILGWEGHQWIPEFSAIMILPVLFAVGTLALYTKLRSHKQTEK
ncbi:MAG: WD40 repeat domain-containing protein [Candidatus Bathyarchaeota archaeon]|nr:WD40 repeat domain-containing protein [Candidatus Bathyarchaeota archaeon]